MRLLERLRGLGGRATLWPLRGDLRRTIHDNSAWCRDMYPFLDAVAADLAVGRLFMRYDLCVMCRAARRAPRRPGSAEEQETATRRRAEPVLHLTVTCYSHSRTAINTVVQL